MGLDFSHCDAHWSYDGFNRFRTRIANQLGLSLDAMDGFGGKTSWDTVADPIAPLLYHSDCEGELTPDECRQVSPRLREIVKDWGEDDYDRYHALDLAKGMEYAAEQNEPLEFM